MLCVTIHEVSLRETPHMDECYEQCMPTRRAQCLQQCTSMPPEHGCTLYSLPSTTVCGLQEFSKRHPEMMSLLLSYGS